MGAPRAGDEPDEHRDKPDDQGGQDPGGDAVDLDIGGEERCEQQRQERREQARQRNDRRALVTQEAEDQPREERAEDAEEHHGHDVADGERHREAGQIKTAQHQGDRVGCDAEEPADEEPRHIDNITPEQGQPTGNRLVDADCPHKEHAWKILWLQGVTDQ